MKVIVDFFALAAREYRKAVAYRLQKCNIIWNKPVVVERVSENW